MGVVVAFAGRRVDAPDAATPRFPRENVALVRSRVRHALVERKATALVSSAACGADLLALDIAGELGMRRVVVLPWERERFRARSVVDRGAEWGALFDRIVDDVTAAGALHVLGCRDRGGVEAYHAVSDAILDLAEELAGQEGGAVAVITAWDGRSRGSDDVTEGFIVRARGRGMDVVEIPTN